MTYLMAYTHLSIEEVTKTNETMDRDELHTRKDELHGRKSS